LPRGLILVTGPTGSGKSTTLASIVNLINSTRRQHILTIEDPRPHLAEKRGSHTPITADDQVGLGFLRAYHRQEENARERLELRRMQGYQS